MAPKLFFREGLMRQNDPWSTSYLSGNSRDNSARNCQFGVPVG
jgi:hypothetical protein